MNKQEALRYMMFDHVPNDPSKKYGKTPIVRCVTAWNVALQLSDNNEDKVDTELLDHIMEKVDEGDNILEFFLSGEYAERGFINDKASERPSGP